MPNIFIKLTRPSRRHRRKGHADGKSRALIDAGIRLLAMKDYDAISMAKIAKEAGCSVGAVYARFPDKNAYLYRLVGAVFHSLVEESKSALTESRWRKQSAMFVAGQIVQHIMAKMTTPRAAGVIRATMKLATVKPLAIELFEGYRAGLTELTVSLLTPRLRSVSPKTIRAAMQIVLATVTDAVMQKRPGPMIAGGRHMTNALTNVLVGCLGISGQSARADEEDEDKDEHEYFSEAEEASVSSQGSNAVYDPDLRAFRKVKKQPSSQRNATTKTKTRDLAALKHKRATSSTANTAPKMVVPPKRPPSIPTTPREPQRKLRLM